MNRYSFLPFVFAVLLLVACGQSWKGHDKYDLRGAWTLVRIDTPMGEVRHYPNNGMTFCRIYSDSSTVSECQLFSTPSGMVIIPGEQFVFTLTDKGGGEVLYMEGDNPRPFKMTDDTTMVIQRHGTLSTWVRARNMTHSRMDEICRIVADDSYDGGMQLTRFVLSTTERRLRTENRILIGLVAAMVAVVSLTVYVIMGIYRRNRRMAYQLKLIKEEREQRPQPVKTAMQEVEEQFFRSDYYLGLRRRIAAGERLKTADWDDVEQRLKSVYPGLTADLHALCHLSELEYRVCLLIKLRVTPSEMAGLLSRDVSTISTVRSRLYHKVFQRKGSSRDWDEFVLSL